MYNKTLRFHKLFHPRSHRAILLPLDHGITQGPIDGLRQIPDIIALAARTNLQGVIAHKGTILWAIKSGKQVWRTEHILHLSASTNLSSDPSNKQIVSSVKQALRMGVTGISVHVNLGVAEEAAMLRDMGMICDEAFAWGLPVLAMMYVNGKNGSAADARKIAHAVRVAGELGADMVKIYYNGHFDNAAEIISAFDIPVLLAGGDKTDDKLEWFRSLYHCLLAGSKGICIGRNIFADERPEAMCMALNGMIHEDKTPEEAYGEYRSYSNDY